MTIHRLLTVSEVADSPFRSVVDVEEYLKKIQEKLRDADALTKKYQSIFARAQLGHKLTAGEFHFKINRDPGKKPGDDPTHPKFYAGKFTKVVVDDLAGLSKNFALARELSDTITELETVYNTASLKFRGVKGSQQMLQNIKAMIVDANNKYDKALAFLNKAGKQYAPTQFQKLVQSTMDNIESGLAYKSSENYLYCHVNDEKQLQFSYFVEIKGLKTEDGTIPSFYIVFTCIEIPLGKTNDVHPKLYVTIMRTFQAPGTFDLGKQVSDYHSASLAIGTLMTFDQMPNSIGTIPHNLDMETLKKGDFSVGSKVADMSGDDNSISFALLKSIKMPEAEQIMIKLQAELRTMIKQKRNTRPNATIDEKDGRLVIKFTINSTDPLAPHELDFLQEDFDLSDRQMQQIRKTIWKGK